MRTHTAIAAILGSAIAVAVPVDSATTPPLPRLATIVARYEATQDDDGHGAGWPDMSKAAADRRTATLKRLRVALAALPAVAPGSEAALTRRLLAWRLDVAIEGAGWDEDRVPFDNGDGFFNTANYAAQTTVIRNEADARAWIARIDAVPRYYAQVTDNLRRGIATGFTAPQPTAESVLAILRLAAAQAPDTSPLLAPLQHLPPTIAPDRQATVRADALAAVTRSVKPAQTAMATFFAADYLPHARPAIAAESLPGGRDYYPFLIRRSTTLPLTPDQVFATGEREIARLTVEMDAARRATGDTGTLPAFLNGLRHDPTLYAPDLTTYVDKASAIGKRIDGLLPLWFGTLPRLPWTIRIKPPELDASSGGYNLGDPAKGVAGAVVVGAGSFHDPLFALQAWMLHEGVPGHHLQIAIGQERTDLPAFRRRDEPTAFIEGWALYAEQLGEEMGVYRTPLEHVGRLSFEMWRACRLVMDVGIHWKGWSAAQAERCLRDHTALPEVIIRGETQRYIAWPAQAVAYKIGEMRFMAERRRAEAALGSRFDIRAFHDAVIDEGPMPLGVLHDQVTRWIAQSGAPSQRHRHDAR